MNNLIPWTHADVYEERLALQRTIALARQNINDQEDQISTTASALLADSLATLTALSALDRELTIQEDLSIRAPIRRS